MKEKTMILRSKTIKINKNGIKIVLSFSFGDESLKMILDEDKYDQDNWIENGSYKCMFPQESDIVDPPKEKQYLNIKSWAKKNNISFNKPKIEDEFTDEELFGEDLDV